MPATVSRSTLFAYYQRAFPFRWFALWLGYGRCPLRGATPNATFRRREFAFRFGDVYLRFRCFDNMEALRSFVLERVPERLELGAVYEQKPDEVLLRGRAVQREFVLDIDLTDMEATGQLYTTATDPSDPAFACSWRFLVFAVRTLDRLLRVDFGFKHILWVFSGRRGVHCWVADERARVMGFEGRAAVVGFLNVDRSPARWAVFARGDNLYPALAEVADTMEKSDEFGAMLEEQQWLCEERRERVLALLVDEHLRAEARERLASVSAKGQRNARLLWHTLRSVIGRPRNDESRKLRRHAGVDAGSNVRRALVLGLTYPVLDTGVSRSPSHLLKAPFAVHPTTGRICVPLDPVKMDSFDPAEIPTAAQAGDDPSCLAPHVAVFRSLFLDPLHLSFVRTAAADF